MHFGAFNRRNIVVSCSTNNTTVCFLSLMTFMMNHITHLFPFIFPALFVSCAFKTVRMAFPHRSEAAFGHITETNGAEIVFKKYQGK